MIFRLCREVDGQIVDLKEIEADTIEEAIAIYYIEPMDVITE